MCGVGSLGRAGMTGTQYHGISHDGERDKEAVEVGNAEKMPLSGLFVRIQHFISNLMRF